MKRIARKRYRPPVVVADDLWGLATDVYAIYDSSATAVLSLVMCRPATGIAFARRFGVSSSTFFAEDLRLIWCACDVCVQNKRPRDAFILARKALAVAGWFGHSAWTDETLWKLATGFHLFCVGDSKRLTDSATHFQRQGIAEIAPRFVAAYRALAQTDRLHRQTLAALLNVRQPRRAA